MEPIITHDAEETRQFGRRISESLKPGTFLAFSGDLGAGKTTLIQGVLEGLEAERPYVSPTFILMKEYDLKVPSKTGIQRIYHADAYRVGASDFEKLGLAEWCADPEGLVLLEWPERIVDILPERRTTILLKNVSEDERKIIIEDH